MINFPSAMEMLPNMSSCLLNYRKWKYRKNIYYNDLYTMSRKIEAKLICVNKIEYTLKIAVSI